MDETQLILLIYFGIVSLSAVCVTVYDKLAAQSVKGSKNRVPEKNLLWLAVLGGSAAEYITMQIIRHKTKHKKFMIGLPVIMLVQIIIGFAVYFFET